MQKLLGIVFILLFSAETLLCPLQDISTLSYLPQIYSQCKLEDPDMNAADFVFEHLMNLECVLSFFDKDANEDKHEKPHQPFQKVQSIAQTVVVVNKILRIEPVQLSVPVFFSKKVYSTYNNDFLPFDFLSEILRPPSVC